jgi:phage major head subunit gpT-like protein
MPHITTSRLDALRTTVDTKWSQAYQAVKNWYEALAMFNPSTTEKNTYGWAAMQVELREWLGERVVQNLVEHDQEIVNKLYEATLRVKRTKVEDDNLGIFTNVQIPQLAQAAKKHPDRLLKALMQANGNGFDGVAFFSDSHPSFDKAGTTYDNDFAQALDANGVDAVFSAMSSIIGENGDPLEIIPDTLIVPPQLYRKALTVNNSNTSALPDAGAGDSSATVDNVMKGWFRNVIMVPELANQPTVWYMADLSKPIKPFVYQLRDAAELTSRINMNDPTVFDWDQYTWGVRIRHNVGLALPFLIARSTNP